MCKPTHLQREIPGVIIIISHSGELGMHLQSYIDLTLDEKEKL